ncbi:MAG: sterol desaturase family protein [Microthrixaceae bacterium]
MELLTVKLLLVPLVVLLVAAEGGAALHRQRTRGDVAGSDLADSLTSGGIGLVGQVVGGVFRWATYLLAGLVPAWASLRWSTDSPLGTAAELIAAVLLWDFLFYWFHRAAHRTNLGWMSHRAHHESEYFNIAVALRLEWFPVLSVPIFATQAFAGFGFGTMAAASIINGFYQGLLHTELVGPLPRPVESVFNTPTHHRSHHDITRVDGANFGSILIVWDRLFGTFVEPSSPRMHYGVMGAEPLRQPLAFLTPLVRVVPALAKPLDRGASRIAGTWEARRHGGA